MNDLNELRQIIVALFGVGALAAMFAYALILRNIEDAKREVLKAINLIDKRNIDAFKQIKPTIKIVEKPIYIEPEKPKKKKGEVYSPESDPMTILEGNRTEMFD